MLKKYQNIIDILRFYLYNFTIQNNIGIVRRELMDDKVKVLDSKLGLFDTISLTMGFTVGSGVITMTGVAIGMTGRSVLISYLLTALTFLVAVFPSLIMASVHPTRSASYTYSKELLHPKLGGLYMYVYFLGRFTIAIFGISTAEYLSTLIPGINQQFVAITVLTFFYIINLGGIDAAAKVQNIMFCSLILSLGIFIVAGMSKVDISAYFRPEGFYVNGFEGVWSAASLLVFAVGGGGVLIDFGSTIKNPAKVIPLVVISVTVFVAIAYAFLSMVAAGLLPYTDVAFKPLTVSAGAVFGTSSWLYVLFILGGALLALTTTLNSSFMWYSNAMIKGCKEGWLPRGFAKFNSKGVPYRLMTVFYLFGLVPTVLNIDITVLCKAAVALTTMMWMVPVFGLVNCPKRYTDEWKNSKFANMPKWSLWLISTISFLTYATQSWLLLKDNPPLSNVLIVVCLIAIFVYVCFIKKVPENESDSRNSLESNKLESISSI